MTSEIYHFSKIKEILQNQMEMDETLKQSILTDLKTASGNHYASFQALVKVIKKIEALHFPCDSTFLLAVEQENQIQLLQEDFIEETIWWMLPNLGTRATEYFFLYDKRALNTIEENHISIPSLIEMKIKIAPYLLYQPQFFEKIKSQSLVEFRRRINLLMQSNPNLFIEEKAEQYEKEMLLSYNKETNLFQPYENVTLDNLIEQITKNTNPYLFSYQIVDDVKAKKIETQEHLKTYLQKETSKKIREIVIDTLFKDNYYNVMMNIEEILRYQKKNPEGYILDIEYIKLYELLRNISELSNNKKIEIYQALKDKNMAAIFYEHVKKCKNHAYTQMLANLFTLDTSFLNHAFSKEVDVYELKGEPFTMMIRGGKPDHSTNEISRYRFLSSTNLDYIDEDFYYGYTHIDKEKIIHVCENADRQEKQNTINRIMTPEEITNGRYIEIQIASQKIGEEYEPFKPDYLVVLKEITKKEIDEAKRFSIPIVKIDRTKYRNIRENSSLLSETKLEEQYYYIETEEDEKKLIKESKRR
jgi:hypothetical protein